LRETARERGRWRVRVRKRKREFTYRSSLAALASPRQEWAESKTANWQQVQPTHAPTRREPDVRRAQKMQCIITKPTSIRSEDLAVSVAQNSECVGLGIPRCHCVQGAVCKRQPTATMRRHVRRASHEEGSGMGASYMQLLPLVAPAPNPSRPQASRHTRVRPMRTMQIQSSYPQVCPFAPK